MRKKRPKHTKTQQKVDKSRKLKENGRNTPKRIKTQKQVQKGKKLKENDKSAPKRVAFYHTESMCFPEGCAAVTSQNPYVFQRVV